jgi:ParB-like chromosome segregation protein Spo0J
VKKKIEYINTEELVPYKKNSRTHSEEQIKQISESMKEFGFTNPVLIDEENEIIAGHGRVLGAKKLGIESVPCIRLEGLTEAQKKAYIIADNKIALNSGWNEDILKMEILDLKDEDFKIGLLGFSDSELDKLLDVDEENEQEAEVEFTEVLGEEHNYIVLYFDNDVDWLQAETLFDIKPKKALSTRADGVVTSSMERIGVGRVLEGKKAIQKILGEDYGH